MNTFYNGFFHTYLIISSLFIISFSITTAIDYDRLKKVIPPTFTLNDANAMIVISSIMSLLAFSILVLSIINLLHDKMITSTNEQVFTIVSNKNSQQVIS